MATLGLSTDRLFANSLQLKSKIDLRQISRTYVLTFLATIYLPFSFMAVSIPWLSEI